MVLQNSGRYVPEKGTHLQQEPLKVLEEEILITQEMKEKQISDFESPKKTKPLM